MVYVALLRGINVGGKTKVAMAALRDTCAAVGCENVLTYIQSGNVVLTSKLGADKLRAALEAAIAADFGFSPAVMIRTATEMAAVIERHPYPDADEGHVHVGFLHTAPHAKTGAWPPSTASPSGSRWWAATSTSTCPTAWAAPTSRCRSTGASARPG